MYERYYAHGLLHIENVIKNCKMLANYYNLNIDMAYTIAAYHDIGLKISRNNHEKESRKIFIKNTNIEKYFSYTERQKMKKAIEDHRSSRKEPPRNIYGKILSDSDRDFDIEILAKRQLPTSIKNYEYLTTFEEHFERCYTYTMERINESGHFNLWTNNPILVKEREIFERNFLNKKYAKSVYKKAWEKLLKNPTIEKIKNYYLDY